MKKNRALTFVSLLPVLLTGCGGSPSASGGFSNTSRAIALTTTVNVLQIKRGFILSSGRPNEAVDYSSYVSYSSLSIADQYYLVYEFDFYSRNDTSGKLLLHASLEFDQITIFDARVIDSNSGADGTPIPYRDPVTGNQINKIDQTFRIPADADESVNQRIVFKINPTMTGTSTMRMNFYPEDQDGVEVIGNGSSGCTIPVDVSEYQIETPDVRYENTLVWDHLKGADYYKIYANGSCLKKADGNDYEYYPAENLAPGERLEFNSFGAYGVYGEYIPIYVIGYSKRAGVGFKNSNPSPTIYINV